MSKQFSRRSKCKYVILQIFDTFGKIRQIVKYKSSTDFTDFQKVQCKTKQKEHKFSHLNKLYNNSYHHNTNIYCTVLCTIQYSTKYSKESIM